MKTILLLLLAALLLIPTPGRAQTRNGQTLVAPELLADTAAVLPGQPFLLGVRYKIASGWHIYWQYPGDSGLAPTIKLTLPPGYTAGDIQWPVPHRKTEPGDMQVYAYDTELLLTIKITPPADLKPGAALPITADLAWLVCREVCVPGQAIVKLTLPGASTPAEAKPAHAETFLPWQARLPIRAALTELPLDNFIWTRPDPKTLRLTLQNLRLPPGSTAEFYPLPSPDLIIGHPSDPTGAPDAIVDVPLTTATDTALQLPGLLVIENTTTGQRDAWSLEKLAATEMNGPAAALVPHPKDDDPSKPGPPSRPIPLPPSLIVLILGAFLGGLLLNIMPCVLPAVSLKIFGFIEQAHQDRGAILRHGLAFSAGVLVWFWAFAITVILLRAAGGSLSWGQQFQDVRFLLFLSAAVLLFALNLLGVFEITLPAPAEDQAARLSMRGGYTGSFLHGSLATLLATPCTGPFMGYAVGIALVQPAPVILLVFTAVGLGLCAPYLLLSANPAWMKFLPRPGAWMVTFKQATGFLLLITLVWLISIIGSVNGPKGITHSLGFLLALSVCAWLHGIVSPTLRTSSARAWLYGIAFAILLNSSYLFLWRFPAPDTTPAGSGPAPGQWREEIASGLAEKRIVFVDFTADWCYNCQANERLILSTDTVQNAFRDSNTKFVKADWTRPDPAINDALKEHNRAGIPLYLVYSPARPDEPIVLPEILTTATVLEALKASALAPAKP